MDLKQLSTDRIAMDSETLVRERIDAGEQFIHKMNEYVPINVAVWGRSSETGRFDLYIASEQITGENFDIAYGEVLRIASELKNPNFDPFQVKIILMDDPLAAFVADLYANHPVKLGSWFRIGSLEGLGVDDGYIYQNPSSTVAKV